LPDDDERARNPSVTGLLKTVKTRINGGLGFRFRRIRIVKAKPNTSPMFNSLFVRNSVKTPAPQALERVVVVVGAQPEFAHTVAESFAVQGEAMRVVWFEQARQVLGAELRQALAGVIVCHHREKQPVDALRELRSALPDTPVLAFELRAAA
jgi:hypothetical protein